MADAPRPSMAPDAPAGESIPRDARTLTEALQRFAARGFPGQLIAREGGRVECTACRTSVAATELDVDSSNRLEGVSDPDDMLLVVAATCPTCGTGGTLVLGYGADASMEDSDVLAAIELPDEPRG